MSETTSRCRRDLHAVESREICSRDVYFVSLCHFLDEENSSTNFNELVVLNALDFSFDLDVDPSADQALTFTWFCKKSDEVCLLYFMLTNYHVTRSSRAGASAVSHPF